MRVVMNINTPNRLDKPSTAEILAAKEELERLSEKVKRPELTESFAKLLSLNSIQTS